VTTRSIARALIFCVAATLAAASAGSRQAKAGGIDTFNPGLPPQGAIGGVAAYLTPEQIHATYSGPALAVVLSNVRHSGFTNIQVGQGTGPGGTGEVEHFNSVLTGVVSINGSPPAPFDLAGPVETIVYQRTSDSETGTFVTQMLSMDLTGNVLGHAVEIMLDPNMLTLGMTSITPETGPGAFHIDSFFDIFTEISIDGSPFTPSTGSTRVTLQTIPEPSALVTGAIAATVGLAYTGWRRRRKT